MSARTFWAAEVIDSGDSKASRVRAWPKVRSPDSTLCWTDSGKRNKRRKLATLARSLPVRCGHLLLGQLEVVAKSLIGAGLLHGVEVGALEIFDDGHLKCLLIRHLADDGGDGGFAGFAAG